MNIQNKRLEDLSKVVDRNWKANHNDDIKNAKIREKKFINRMFNVKDSNVENTLKTKTPNEQVKELQKNINGIRAFNNQNRNNSLRGKFN